MKKYSSNMLTYLNQQTTNLVQNKEEDKYKIQMVDIRNIVPNVKNFYGIRDIEGLAKRIQASKHITPLAIVEDADGYRLMSGERRYQAVMLLIKKGERTDYAVPCRVYKPFQQCGKLTPEMQEMICIISENDYRTKNILEKYQEIARLEPIYRIFFEESGETGTFRAFYAEKLGVSDSSLQRILSVKKLTVLATEAIKDGILKDSVAVDLASLSEVFQNQFIQQLRDGKIEGTYKDIKQLKNAGNAEKEQALSNEHKEKLDKLMKNHTNAQEEDSDKSEKFKQCEDELLPENLVGMDGSDADDRNVRKEKKFENDQKNDDTSVYVAPKPNVDHVNWQDGQKEVDGWLIKKLGDIFNEAVKKSSAANGLDAAKWELYQARIKWVIEKIKSNEE